ncbi:hypothetical protein DFH06DRAFT_728667 [Mycena polygramma]|nr:hypothetical protein DFH06DRAFT_728667 [Mycena polygramma]
MSLWNAAAAAFAPITNFLASGPHGRKTRHPSQSYKPAQHVTLLQQCKRQQRSFGSDTDSAYSSSSSSSSSFIEEELPPPRVFDPESAPVTERALRARMEFAQMRIHGQWHGGPQLDVFAHPGVHERLEQQVAHDRASLARLPSQAPAFFTTNPLGAPAQPRPLADIVRNPSRVVRKYNSLQGKISERKHDQAVYAAARGLAPVPAVRDVSGLKGWPRYEQTWVNALSDPEDSAPLSFKDIPWPVAHIPLNGSHITAVDVQRFVLCTKDTDHVPEFALDRVSAEIERWQTDNFNARVLPRVVPYERRNVAAADAVVLDMLITLRQDLTKHYGQTAC